MTGGPHTVSGTIVAVRDEASGRRELDLRDGSHEVTLRHRRYDGPIETRQHADEAGISAAVFAAELGDRVSASGWWVEAPDGRRALAVEAFHDGAGWRSIQPE